MIDRSLLEELLLAWQVRLSLRDWDIKVRFIYAYEASGNYWGAIEWNLHEKVADIKIRYPGEAPPSAMRPFDLEVILVHELLHIHFAPFDATVGADKSFCPSTRRAQTGSAELAQEQAINAIAKALVNLGRIYNDQD